MYIMKEEKRFIMRIAYFGGAFDPPHTGHLAEARAMLKRGAAERVWFAPSYAPPHKPHGGRASFDDRLEMLLRLVAGEPGMLVSAVERELALSPSYTFRVLTELARRRPLDRFVLLIGGDSLRDLHRWYRGRDLAETFEVWTYPRPGMPVTADDLAEVWPRPMAEKLASRVLPGALSGASSSEVRAALGAGRRTPDGALTAPVLEYIREKGLYGGERVI